MCAKSLGKPLETRKAAGREARQGRTRAERVAWGILAALQGRRMQWPAAASSSRGTGGPALCAPVFEPLDSPKVCPKSCFESAARILGAFPPAGGCSSGFQFRHCLR